MKNEKGMKYDWVRSVLDFSVYLIKLVNLIESFGVRILYYINFVLGRNN